MTHMLVSAAGWIEQRRGEDVKNGRSKNRRKNRAPENKNDVCVALGTVAQTEESNRAGTHVHGTCPCNAHKRKRNARVSWDGTPTYLSFHGKMYSGGIPEPDILCADRRRKRRFEGRRERKLTAELSDVASAAVQRPRARVLQTLVTHARRTEKSFARGARNRVLLAEYAQLALFREALGHYMKS